MRQFAIAFAAAGHDVEVACLDRPSESFLADFPCTLHAIGPCYLGSYAYSPKFQYWLRKNAVRFDLLVMHGIWNFPALAVRQEAIRAGKPYGVFVHGALDPWFDQQYPLKRLKKSMYWPLLYPVLRDARAVFFTAQSEAELAKTTRRPNAWNSVVVPLGISDPGMGEEKASRQRAIFSDKYPELQRRRFLLFLARIHTKKGCDLLIDAFARVDAAVAAKQAFETDEIKNLFEAQHEHLNRQEIGERTEAAVGAAEVTHAKFAADVKAAFVPVTYTLKIEAQ